MKQLFFTTIGIILLLQPGPVADSTLAGQAVRDGTQSHQPKPLTLEDYGRWSTIGEVALSGDGGWMTYALEPNEGDALLFLQDLDRLDAGPREMRVNGSGPDFSDDSRWLAFVSRPGEEREEGEGGRSTGGEDVPDRSRTLHLQDLQDPEGWAWEVENPSSYFFSDDSRWLAVRKGRSGRDDGEASNSERGGDAPRGTDLLLRDLSSGSVRNLGNVAEAAFNEGSTLLAYVVDAADRAGNGLFVLELGSGRIVPLSTGDFLYQGMAWNEGGTALAVLRGIQPEGRVQRENRLLTIRELGPVLQRAADRSGRPEMAVYDPSDDPAFPEKFVISEFRTPSWSQDASRVFFGIREQEEVGEESDEPRPDVVVWHWKDERVQSRQRVQAGGDRRATDLSTLNLETTGFVRLEDEDMDQVQLTEDGRWGVGFDDSPYVMDRDHPDNRNDVYRIDPASGERRLISRALVHRMGFSPDSEWFLFWQDRRMQAFGLGSGEIVDLTEVAGGVDFENKEFDRPVEKPAYGVGGWSSDGRVVFLNHKYDIWQVPLGGGEAVNLTGGMGDREEVRFRIMDLDPEDAGIDREEPLLLSGYGEWTKRSGYFRARPGRDPEELLFDDAMFGTPGFRGAGLQKAEASDRVVFTRQTFQEFPDYWVSDHRFREPRRITDANPQQEEYLWGSRVLVDYTDDRGHDLQATLTLPAGYEDGRRYPMIVYFYEKMSQRHHQYSQPTYDDRPHMSTYASNGYLVLMPDIVYDMGHPGSSALDDVVSAAEEVVEAGYADGQRICLQGHSWGGYETSFILTQTDMFACVVTGAPLTNLVSMHNILYKRSGTPNAGLIEWGQGRMDTTPFHDLDRYVDESPVHNVRGISTPFLILHGTEDGAVDWNQGLEYYIAARRMGKEVILLSYPGEPHHLSREENQKDFQVRMKQYFDHHLKDAPAPTWMTEGVPYLERDRIGPRHGTEEDGGEPGL